MYFKEELKEQEKGIGVLKYIFFPIFFVIFIIAYFRDNSLEYREKQYKEVNDDSYSGVVYKKVAEGEGRNPHYLYLILEKEKQLIMFFMKE